MKNKSFEPMDARDAFHQRERQCARDKRVGKWLSSLLILIAIAIVFFVLYAYFIDKPVNAF
ncbi:MAG: hypothetical protein LKE47_09660 [Prevotella sp.]|jgi:hypothetical protein|nr:MULTISPECIES: hypothetical protein [unclassified Prevotella]MCH3970633.1 hypothetical protein [Prevotella sp.]MCH3984990.1 hypothetical protein [Prevotella sp.]MCH3991564.1 hypothetical protein [Prevotella sp.]MCH4018739.1 hypothetical protein [Prevotella sp.]MCH4186349.1 hypothetical protein [Prevotella sp.]